MVTEMCREGWAERVGCLGRPRTWVDARNGAMARLRHPIRVVEGAEGGPFHT
jgi:hypothetical protein